ncbi:hypothetical protein J0X19_09125 [Hymenobacter sp. BT186]|uniref:Uncharacterized protein n=1 Tax=Hymenobacter telluris TaxID=2816474 RepID=A0A939EY91_9BACT|nr:hypothetical protein [Hymenobacter telluris]MBO0358103.1 hypothetical protein [Hymenobacter telluris]MBW3374130.1 hypothetical protein [Hymenobacter norwichensis]
MRDTPAANITQQALSYFQSPQPYFWHWVENGEVIEWTNGTTICYREELVQLLSYLAPDGLPSLSTLLLVLAACNDGWGEADDPMRAVYNLLYNSRLSGTRQQPAELKALVDQATSFLQVVAALPPELRKGLGKRQLLFELFAQQYRPLPGRWAQAVVDEWASGRLDTQLLASGPTLTSQRLEVDLSLLSRAYTRFPTTEILDSKLFTGLNQAPEPLELLPLPAAPEAADVLSELAADPKTAGLARLTQRLVASIRIPLHAQGTSDQPFGGVSDVSNQGSFDRLLLSELAQDDLTLTARLVNNEALYLRREEPPHQEQRQRALLLDTTLRMWGIPRVFALAAALVCAMPRRQLFTVSAYALGGHQVQPLDLTTKTGVTQSLAHLDPALHCGGALQEFVRTLPPVPLTEALLFTTAEQVQQPAFALLLSELKPALRFLITVDRTGELQLHEFTKAGRILLNTTHHDLDELLFAPSNLPLRPSSNEQPAFLAQHPAPLFFPTFAYNPGPHNTMHLPDMGVVAVTSLQRILYWPHRTEGARELLSFVEAGKTTFGFNGHMVCLLVSDQAKRLLRYYQLLPEGEMPLTIDLSTEIKDVQSTLEVHFIWPNFLVRVDANIRLIDCRTGVVVKRTYFDHTKKPDVSSERFNNQQIKLHVNNGYNVLLRVNRISIDNEGILTVGGHSLRLINEDRLKFTNKTKDSVGHEAAQAESDSYFLPFNKHVAFRRFVWPNGSEAVVDGRGLLHLRSTDDSVPEITLVLVLGQATAAWAADGKRAGSSYFIGTTPANFTPSDFLPANTFYQQYIQQFIKQLL